MLTVKSSRLNNRNSINHSAYYKRSDLPKDRVKLNESKPGGQQIKLCTANDFKVVFLTGFMFPTLYYLGHVTP